MHLKEEPMSETTTTTVGPSPPSSSKKKSAKVIIFALAVAGALFVGLAVFGWIGSGKNLSATER
jgi:uncharacterized protein HemX